MPNTSYTLDDMVEYSDRCYEKLSQKLRNLYEIGELTYKVYEGFNLYLLAGGNLRGKASEVNIFTKKKRAEESIKLAEEWLSHITIGMSTLHCIELVSEEDKDEVSSLVNGYLAPLSQAIKIQLDFVEFKNKQKGK